MKKLLFVSTGRCGTMRIAQILRKYLPADFAVVHQMQFSRLANVAGNIFYYFGSCEKAKQKLYRLITAKYHRGKYFICSDPLTAMIIPQQWATRRDVCIVHIERDAEIVADSLLRISRKRLASFMAHNFIPLWQIDLWPLENLIGRDIKQKYMHIAALKNKYFAETYSINPNYVRIQMARIFNSNFLNDLIYDLFRYRADIPDFELTIKVN
jgi:hypothetical protein